MIFLTCDVRLLVCKVCEPNQADNVIGHLDIPEWSRTEAYIYRNYIKLESLNFLFLYIARMNIMQAEALRL